MRCASGWAQVRFCEWGPHVVAADLVVGGLSAAAAADDATQTVVNNQTMFLCLTDDQMSSKAWEAVLSVRCKSGFADRALLTAAYACGSC